MADYKSKYLVAQQSLELSQSENATLKASVTRLSEMEQKYSDSLQELAAAKDNLSQLQVELARQVPMNRPLDAF